MDEERARYIGVVERRFVRLRQRGILLSPRDVALLDGWRERGVPLRLVLAVIEEGVEQFRARNPPGTPLPTTLAYFESMVEREAALRVERLGSSGAAEGGAEVSGTALAQAVLDAIEADGRRLEEGRARSLMRQAWRTLKDAQERGAGSSEVWGLTGQVAEHIVNGLADALPRAERDALEAEARESLADDGVHTRLSQQAREDRVRHLVAAKLRERFGVRDLTEVLLECDEAL